jgi:hypothetical protein
MPKIQIIRPDRIAGDVYDVSDIVGKTLFPKSTVDVYSNTPSNGGKKIGTINSGNPAGVVTSWVTDKATNHIWWQFMDSKGAYYYIEHAAGRFDVSSLKQQGVLTTEQKVEEQKKKEQAAADADKPWYEQLTDNVGSTVKPILWLVGGAIAVSFLLKK